ncbi:hypothetical protein [Escherichia coli]|uniref:hypothetical protein n=1 Tax=Escherichia coli TaxID=562 RepID=UPI000BE1BF26|nr:hypothetical protein [Escherichia coli]EJM2326955.1 hypothetical protein [Escherichia coli]HBN6464422.1 hypothetical protein [Escherichia coli]
MSRTSKKKNVIEVISKALQTQPGRQAVASSRKLYEMEVAIPGQLLIFTLETDSPELTDHELELIQSMGPGVYFNPRSRKQTIVNSDNLKHWQVSGHQDYVSFLGWCQFQGVNRMRAGELDALFSIAENNKD